MNYSVADFDDGLIHIGTKYCFNRKDPDCCKCEIQEICEGRGTSLVENYTT